MPFANEFDQLLLVNVFVRIEDAALSVIVIRGGFWREEVEMTNVPSDIIEYCRWLDRYGKSSIL